MNRSVLTLLLIFSTTCAFSQSLDLPPSGGNQKCKVTQWMGPVSITVKYNSPDVTGPQGKDRRGHIWGELVPYGLAANSFGTAKEIPWRAGANENTIIYFSHDVKVEGKELSAGKYGLHMIPGETEWTIIFSKNHSSWGSYFYNPDEDALRVTVTPKQSTYHEWLTYSFVDRKLDKTVAALMWEDLMVPFTIEADVNSIYLAKIKDDLRGSVGFDYKNWIAAANFCVNQNINLEEALEWAEYAISAPFIGVKDFGSVTAKANVMLALQNVDEAKQLIDEALQYPSADMSSVHQYGRQLIGMGKNDLALMVFETNRKNNPEDNFTTYVGLGRGYQAVGKNNDAIKNFELAVVNAPDGQKSYYQSLADALK